MPDCGRGLRICAGPAAAPVLRRLSGVHHLGWACRIWASQDELSQYQGYRNRCRASQRDRISNSYRPWARSDVHAPEAVCFDFLRPFSKKRQDGWFMKHVIRQYKLEAGAQEVAYMEELFTEFSGRKTANDT